MRKLPFGPTALCAFIFLTTTDVAAEKPPLVAPQSQPATVPSAASSPQRPFVKLGVLEANAILTKIRKQDFAVIFQAMLDAGRIEHDLTKQLSIQTTFGYALAERTPTKELLDSMKGFIADKKNPDFERGLVLGVLGIPQTKETVDALLDITPTLSDKDLQQGAFNAISQIGAGGGNHEDLSPALERMWRESSDQVLLVYVAKAIAQVGASSGINLLLDHAFAEKDDAKRRAAWGALVSVRMFNPNSIPPLAERLSQQPLGSPRNKLLRDTLARLTTPAAATALLNWLQSVDESVAPIVHDYVLAATSPAQIAAWESAVSPAVTFRNEKNREAIKAGLAQYHRDRGY